MVLRILSVRPHPHVRREVVYGTVNLETGAAGEYQSDVCRPNTFVAGDLVVVADGDQYATFIRPVPFD